VTVTHRNRVGLTERKGRRVTIYMDRAGARRHRMRSARQRITSSFRMYQFEVFVGWLALCIGIPTTLDPRFTPATLQDVYPDAILRLWAPILGLGGILKLWGLFRDNVHIRRAGLMLLGGATLVVTLSLFALFLRGDVTRLLGIGIYGLFTLACYSRFRELGRVLAAQEHARQIEREGVNGVGGT
jgi:hypothetical protein